MVRKNRSILVFLLLALSLQAAQVQAYTLKSFSDSVYSWFQEKSPFSGIFVVGILGLAAYYLFSGSKTKKESTKQENEPLKNKETFELVNLEVSPQKNSECAYHAFKNGLFCYETHYFNQPIKKSDLNRFTSKDEYNKLFDDWCKVIIKERKKQALKEDLQNQLLPYLVKIQSPTKENISPLIFTEYSTAIKNCAGALAEQAVESFYGSFSTSSNYIINSTMIYAGINPTQIKATIMQSTQLPESCLGKVTEIENCISDVGQHFPKLDNINIIIDNNKLNILLENKYSSYGDNLEGDELLKLLNHASNLEKVRQHFSILDDVDQTTKEENFNLDKNAWKKNSNYIHIFLVGTMREKNRNSSGHWFMIAAQKLDGKKTFYTADSLGIDRTNDERVQKIIQYLEN